MAAQRRVLGEGAAEEGKRRLAGGGVRDVGLVGYLTNAYTPAMLAVAECDFGLRAKDRARTRQLNTRDDQGRYGGHINDMVRAGKWQVMKALEKEEPFLLVVGPGIHPELFDEKPSMYWVDQVKAPKGGGFHGKELKAAGKLCHPVRFGGGRRQTRRCPRRSTPTSQTPGARQSSRRTASSRRRGGASPCPRPR